MIQLKKIVTLLVITLIASGCSLLGNPGNNLTENGSIKAVPVERVNSRQSKKTFLPSIKPVKLPEIELVYNREVERELHQLSKSSRMTTERAIENSSPHMDTIQQIFHDEGIPKDLVNVAFLESGFNNEARSPAGALGMWQFMKSTAKYYGLRIALPQDERKDVILSTLAAARHLRDLYANYNDWYLALAAYNVGPGGLERAMRRGGTRDFWELARKGLLPVETQRFVPRFLAAAMIMRDPGAYGFSADQTNIG